MTKPPTKCTLRIIVGPRGCGKTELARELESQNVRESIKVVSLAVIQKEVERNSGAPRGEKLIKAIRLRYVEEIFQNLEKGISVIADATNRSTTHLDNLIERAIELNAVPIVIFYDRPFAIKSKTCSQQYLVPTPKRGIGGGTTILEESARLFWGEFRELVLAARAAGAEVECRVSTAIAHEQLLIQSLFPVET